MPPDPNTVTLAAIALAAMSPIGAYAAQERRIANERKVERDRKDAEAKASDLDRLQRLIDEAMVAAQQSITYLESVGPRRIPAKPETDKYAEGVRLALWRMGMELGREHEIVGAYQGVADEFAHWDDVSVGGVPAAQRVERPDQLPRVSFGEKLRHRFAAPFGAADSEWHSAREQTRAALRQFSDVALRYVAIPSYVMDDAQRIESG